MRRPTALSQAFGLAAALLLSACAGIETDDAVLESSHAAISRDGDVIGTRERLVREVDGGIAITSRQTMRVATDGTRPVTLVEERTRIEDGDRNTVAVVRRSELGRYETVTTADISEAVASVRRESPIDTRETTIALPAGLRFDNGAGLIADWDPDVSPELEFYALDIRAPLVERIVYSFDGGEPEEGGRTLVRTSWIGGDLRSLTRLRLDEDGGLLESEQAMFGSAIQTSPAPQAGTGGNSTSNPVRESLIRSPYRISRQAMRGHIRYTFSLDADVAFQPPQTGEQRVTATPNGFLLDICSTCGPGMDSSEVTLTEALEPTFWLQADHRRLSRIGQTVRDSDATDSEKMARLERWARQRMEEIDFAGHYSAAEALARGSGDCTEGAVVLAALGRAAGIPTRVASGIVYSRERYHGVSHAFMPHAWTLAYVDGEWKSFDMSLDGFDATHIALTISDGDPGSIQSGHQLAALLRWEGMTEVRPRPAD